MKNETETWPVLLSHNKTFNNHNIIPKTVQLKLKMTPICHEFEYQIVYILRGMQGQPTYAMFRSDGLRRHLFDVFVYLVIWKCNGHPR